MWTYIVGYLQQMLEGRVFRNWAYGMSAIVLFI